MTLYRPGRQKLERTKVLAADEVYSTLHIHKLKMSHAFAARTAYEHQPLRLCSQNATDGNTSHCKYRHSVFQKSQSAWTYYIDYDDDDNAGSQHSLYNIIMNYDVSHNNVCICVCARPMCVRASPVTTSPRLPSSRFLTCVPALCAARVSGVHLCVFLCCTCCATCRCSVHSLWGCDVSCVRWQNGRTAARDGRA